jgi:sugar phosphate isomerase/epimerase
MKIGSATYCRNDLETELESIRKIGFEFAEIDLGLPVEPNEELRTKIKSCKTTVPILVGHLPQIDFRPDEIERCKKFVEILSETGCRTFVIHLFSRNLSTQENLNLKINSLRELAICAKNRNSILALENTEEDVDRLNEVFSKIDEIDFCLDIGHANLFARKNRSLVLIARFGKILKHVHVHDNNGGDSEKYDAHLPLGRGNISFEPIISKLKDTGYSGDFTLEIHSGNEEDKKTSIDLLRKLLNFQDKD